MDTTISIIVPIYNAMPYLTGCINSILNQSYKNWELILIDDGSTDESGPYCDAIADKCDKIRVYHQNNKGLVSSRQTGIKLSEGEYILFVDADDEIDIDLVKFLSKAIKEYDADVILFGLIEKNLYETVKRNNYFESGYYTKERIVKEILSQMISGAPFYSFHILPNLVCKCMKKEWLDSCVYEISTNVTYGEDADFSYQIIPQANSLQILDIYSYYYFKREESMVGAHVDKVIVDSLERDFMKYLDRVEVGEYLKDSFMEYLSFVRLVKCPETIIDVDNMFPSRVAIYGAGGFGQAIKKQLKDRCVLWVDKEYKRYKNVYSPESLLTWKDEYDVILIAILNASVCKGIIEQFKNVGLNKRFAYFDRSDSVIKAFWV